MMRSMFGFAAGMVVGSLLCMAGAGGWGGLRAEDETGATKGESPDSSELATLYEQDQADRSPKDGKPIDWRVVGPRDRQREARVKALYESDSLRTGKDYYRAAMVLQHASKPEDFLLAHEFCVVALAQGEKDARWLAAATEDRFLMNISRPQRFGTQYRSSGPTEPVRLYEVGPGVTDALRQELGVPTLAKAREREAEMNAVIHGKGAPPK